MDTSTSAVDFELSPEEYAEVLRLATRYKKESKKCLEAKAYLAGCVLLGAALEALLLSTANCFPTMVTSAKCAPKRDGKVKSLKRWSLADLLKVADELGWLPDSLSEADEWSAANAKIGDYANLMRRVRNLVHPAQYAVKFAGKRVTKKYYKSCYKILDAAAGCLMELVETSQKVMLEELERRASNTSEADRGDADAALTQP